jgi:hypothetical protein
MRNLWVRCLLLISLGLSAGCAHFATGPLVATPAPNVQSPNLDAQTQALMEHADHVVFVIPFSHWDTDWHDTFPNYAKRSDQNIIAAIQMARQYPRFRYTLEQVLFVQHFWDNYSEYHAELKALVQNRQITFAWAGIAQPETSLVAPAIQVRNLQLGEDWIAATFGPAYIPHTAWQSDAFGNSAALPISLDQFDIPYLFVGRWQDGCDPDYQKCNSLPLAFHWTSPVALPGATAAHVLVTYLSYPTAWDAIHTLTNQDQQIAKLGQVIDAQIKRTTSKYIFLPMGSDFQDPLPNLPTLVDRWNSLYGQRTALVMADPETAFQYLATQKLPQVTVDLNPIWQAFYDTRPEAKIADKESAYLLTAADKFGPLLNSPQPSAWLTATINAHYDNISGVAFDSVWTSTPQPRFEQTVTSAGNDLADILARIASQVPAAGAPITNTGQTAPLVIFNPTSWARSEVVEIKGNLPDASLLPAPVQRLGPNDIAVFANSVPGVGFVAPTSGVGTNPSHPASVHQAGDLITLTNGLVTATLDPRHGGAFSSLSQAGGPELFSTFGDDVVYLDDTGDVYGAFFGKERARESQTTAQVTVLATGPLIARAQAVFTLGDQPITKTVTLRADSSLIEVTLDIKALPQTTALVQTPTTFVTDIRTDDLGFAAFQHQVDTRPIVPGDVTYRRKIFYPIMYWSDVSAQGHGLTLITHGLQGMNGTDTVNFMLVREVSDQGRDGVTDSSYHALRYAYAPHDGDAASAQPWIAAYAFNQPLIPVWRSGSGESLQLNVQLPFSGNVITHPSEVTSGGSSLPSSLSLMSAQGGLIADVYRKASQTWAVIINYDPSTAVTIRTAPNVEPITLPRAALTLTPIELK